MLLLRDIRYRKISGCLLAVAEGYKISKDIGLLTSSRLFCGTVHFIICQSWAKHELEGKYVFPSLLERKEEFPQTLLDCGLKLFVQLLNGIFNCLI